MRHHPFANNEITQLRAETRRLAQMVRQLQNAQVTTVPIYNDSALFTGDAVDGQMVVDSTPATPTQRYYLNGAWYGISAIRTIPFVIDGGGSAITTGIKGDLPIDFNCTIVGWTLLADQVGSIVVNLWKDTYANYPPTVADKITALVPPTISTDLKNQSTVLTGWTTAVTAGDTIRVNVDSAATITRATVALKVLT